MKSKTYTQSKRPLDKNQSSKFCQSGVKQTHFQNLKEKGSGFFDHRGTLTFAVLDDQSTDVFVTDNPLNELCIDGKEVNLQVNTIVGTNTVRTRRVCGLQVQDVNGEYSPVKVCYANAQESIPATHHDIATPEIARQWEHLKTIADKIPYRPERQGRRSEWLCYSPYQY